jgi:small subunit ribosomal protein S16
MAVKIRLKRIGAKNDPAYRIVVTDGRSPRDGRFIEELGTYLPARKNADCTLNLARAQYWISKGAQPSDTVRSLMRRSARAAAATAA